jgi:hypothetical protein
MNNPNNYNEQMAAAKKRKEEKKRELQERGFEQSQTDLEYEFDELIENLKKKTSQPTGNTFNTIQKFKNEKYYPKTYLQELIKDVYYDHYKLHNTVKRINRTEKQTKNIQDLLKVYETRAFVPSTAKVNNWNSKLRRPSFTKRLKTLNPFTKRRTQSFGGKRHMKTRKH